MRREDRTSISSHPLADLGGQVIQLLANDYAAGRSLFVAIVIGVRPERVVGIGRERVINKIVICVWPEQRPYKPKHTPEGPVLAAAPLAYKS